MNKIIKDELNKVDAIKIDFNDNTTFIHIPQKREIKLENNSIYLIRLSRYLLSPPLNDNLSINWNNGNIPKHEYYKIDVNKSIGDMINVTGTGYDMNNRIDINDIWEGWLPRSEIEILEKL